MEENSDKVQQHSTPARLKPSATAPPPPDEVMAFGDVGAAGTKDDLMPRKRDSVDFALRYPVLEAYKSDDPKADRGLVVEDVEDDSDRPLPLVVPSFRKVSKCRGMVESFMVVLFDCFVLVLEVLINLWLASKLYEQELIQSYQSTIVIMILPCIFNSAVWLGLKSSYSEMETPFILALVLLGFPSPFFVYIWHLYKYFFGTRPEDASLSRKAKQLANTFRMVQAFVMSVPLILINIVTLINVFRVPGQEHEEVDFDRLSSHLEEVKMHGLAFFISLLNLIRASCLFNERQSFTLLFVLVGFPFILLTVTTRVMALGIIVAFMRPEWTSILLLGLTFVNIVLYVTCRKRRIVYPRKKSTTSSEFLKQGAFEMEDATGCNGGTGCSGDEAECSCCCRGYTYAPQGEEGSEDAKDDTFKGGMLKTILISTLSIVVPSSYTNDGLSHHPRLKGGVFLLLNFLTTMAILGSALGYTILHYVPNTIRGVVLPQPSVQVQVPGSKVFVAAMGLDVSLDLPHTQMDLGSMPAMSATIDTTSNDLTLAIAAPLILSLIVFPFVTMRAAMMELDCFITSRKALNAADMEKYVYKKKKYSTVTTHSDLGRATLVDTIAENIDNKEMKVRMYVTLCCGMLGMFIMVLVFMLAGALLVMNIGSLSDH